MNKTNYSQDIFSAFLMTVIRKRARPLPESPPEKRKLRKCNQENAKLRAQLSMLETKHELLTDYLCLKKNLLTLFQ